TLPQNDQSGNVQFQTSAPLGADSMLGHPVAADSHPAAPVGSTTVATPPPVVRAPAPRTTPTTPQPTPRRIPPASVVLPSGRPGGASLPAPPVAADSPPAAPVGSTTVATPPPVVRAPAPRTTPTTPQPTPRRIPPASVVLASGEPGRLFVNATPWGELSIDG